MSGPTDDIAVAISALLKYHRRTRPLEPAREIRLAPHSYRRWREIGGPDEFQGVPIRCSERLGDGVWGSIVWSATTAKP